MNGKLAGDDGRMAAVAVLEDLQEVVASRGVERFEAPVVEDEQIDAAERAQQTRVAAVAARQCALYVVLVSCLLCSAFISEDQSLAGYSADSARTERDWESKFRALPAAENQRDRNPNKQRLSLINLGHIEARHDDDEDEQVVDRQAVLSEPSRKELQRELLTVRVPRPDSKAHREADIGRQSNSASTHPRFAGLTHHYDEVDQ